MNTLLKAISSIIAVLALNFSFAYSMPDLDVGFISRTPLYNRFDVSFDGDQHIKGGMQNEQKWPKPEDLVTYTAHVFNKGDEDVSNILYRWYFDDVQVREGIISFLPAGDDSIELSYSSPWPVDTVCLIDIPAGAMELQLRQYERAVGDHRIRFELDPEHTIAEECELNNSIEDYINALYFWMYMDETTYTRFNARKNYLESRSAEDWCQMQLMGLERRLRASGCPQKIRLDMVQVVPDGTLDTGGGHTPIGDYVRHTDGAWGFCFTEWNETKISSYAKIIENSLMHELGHQIGLVDIYNFDTTIDRCLITLPGRGRVAGTELMPVIERGIVYYGSTRMTHAGGQALVDRTPRGLMADNTQYLEPGSVAGLNRNYGLRRGFYGDYLGAVPQGDINLVVRQADGSPVPNCSIRVFQRESAPPGGVSVIRDIPKFIGVTDSQGIWKFPHVTERSWWGGINVNNPWSSVDDFFSYKCPLPFDNPVLVVELGFDDTFEYHFVEASECNTAMGAGVVSNFAIVLTTYNSRATNRLPIINVNGEDYNRYCASVIEGGTYTATITATDPDGDPVTLSTTPLYNSTFDPASGQFTFTPDSLDVNWTRDYAGDNAPYHEPMEVIIKADDGKFCSTKIISIQVSDREGEASRNERRLPCNLILNPLADSDGDGMADLWEERWGFDPHDPSDSSGDADGDGISNLHEFLAGSNPRHSASDTRFFVDGRNIAGCGYGTEQKPYSRIQDALNDPDCRAGNEIIVSQGIYRESINFNGLAVTVRSTDPSDEAVVGNTIIEGQGRSAVIFCSSELRDSIIRGFTIRNTEGIANGGAIKCVLSYPTIADNIITGNSAVNGGGIYCNWAMPLIVGNKIWGNSAVRGAGMFFEELGRSSHRWPYYSAKIAGNMVGENIAGEEGGGIYTDTLDLNAVGNSIVHNRAGGVGGGIYDAVSQSSYSSNLIALNSAAYGGGVYADFDGTYPENGPYLVNDTVADNAATQSGGGVYFSNADFSTFYDYPIVVNSVFWGNTNGELRTDPQIVDHVAGYSCIRGGWQGEGNINADPRFISKDNYRLRFDSPCIDKGTSSYVATGDTDPDGNPRKTGLEIDIGAYEARIMDDPQAAFATSRSGINWGILNEAGAYGGSCHLAPAWNRTLRADQQVHHVATWVLAMPMDGLYDIYERHPQGSGRAPNAPFELWNNNYTQRLANTTVDQRSGGGRWNFLMRAPMKQGIYKLRLSNAYADGKVVADAIGISDLGEAASSRISGIVILDKCGAVFPAHRLEDAPIALPQGCAPYASGQDRYRDMKVVTDSAGGVKGYYVLDCQGRVFEVGAVPRRFGGGTPARVPSREMGLSPAFDSLYVLLSRGIVFSTGATYGNPDWGTGSDMAKDIELVSAGNEVLGYYILDAYGAVHPYPAVRLPAFSGCPYWPNMNIARDLEVVFDEGTGTVNGYYVLDGFGGIHAVGNVPTVEEITRAGYPAPYFAGKDIARKIKLVKDDSGNVVGIYLADGTGVIHPIGLVEPFISTGLWPGSDVLRDMEIVKAPEAIPPNP
ncbi:MAG: hypothetical protein NTZ78_08195 [Candidatus Aureabacteria bacterium]|nr:hypothetical protein [Candidatus Auribacterota bacterium]